VSACHDEHEAGVAAEDIGRAEFCAVSGGLLGELGAVQRVGRLAGRAGCGFNNMEQGKRHSRLDLAHGSVTQQIGQMTGSVYAKDEEDLVAARYPDVLSGSGPLLAVVFARGQS
jgi:hypothetical protein